MKKKIKIIPNGPYEVSKGIPLKKAVIGIDSRGTSEKWIEGREYESGEESYYLCRCGHSSNKPYCDGTHEKIKFEGREYASKEPYVDGCKVFEGPTIDLYDNEELCASMRFCDRGKGVWQATMDSDDPSSKKLAIQEACDCAAGRLTVVTKDGEAIEPDLPEEISPIQDTAAGVRGPLWIKGGIELEGADGESYEVRNRMTLCRCGESKNMPYCDISHMNCEHMKGFDK